MNERKLKTSFAMYDLSDHALFESVKRLLVENNIFSKRASESLLNDRQYQSITADGSNRIFLRVQTGDAQDCIIVIPESNSSSDIAESRSAWKIGKHLHGHGVPVPELYGWDAETGVLLLEDLGDRRLHDRTIEAATNTVNDDRAVYSYYLETIKNLVKMQVLGAKGFQESWCCDTPRYDTTLMIEKESLYFLNAFWQGLLGFNAIPDVEDECRDLAQNGSRASTEYFLHRDFQCRNIMIKENRVRFIDFQGGRFGPLAYDIASLLIDPYAALTTQFQEKVLHEYMDSLGEYLPVDRKVFIRQYNLLAVQRNLQIIGAFSYLSKVRGKFFFKKYVRPALLSLDDRLQEIVFAEYTNLKAMVRLGLKETENFR